MKEKIFKAVMVICTSLLCLFFFSILFYVLVGGLKNIAYVHIEPIVGTLLLVILTLSISAPISILTAIYLAEYKKKGKFITLLRTCIDTLNSVPSIVYGLFGLAFFVVYLKFITGGISLLSGALTLAIMVLPVLIRVSEQAILAVPKEYREASLALGATKLQTIFKVVLPCSFRGILTGIILAMGRIVGESAPLIFTAAILNNLMPTSIFDPSPFLSTNLYFEATEGRISNAYATALVLLIIVLVLNIIAKLAWREK